jgi:hypothetical protein
MRDVVAKLRAFAAEFTNLSHDKLQNLNCSCKPGPFRPPRSGNFPRREQADNKDGNTTLAPKLQFSLLAAFSSTIAQLFGAGELTCARAPGKIN